MHYFLWFQTEFVTKVIIPEEEEGLGVIPTVVSLDAKKLSIKIS